MLDFYWSNPPFLIFWHLGTLAVPECQKINKGGLDQYGAEHFEVWPFDTTGLERVNHSKIVRNIDKFSGRAVSLKVPHI